MNIYSIHKTREGNEILICEMTDSHLANMVSFLCKRISEAEKFLKGETLPVSKTAVGIATAKYRPRDEDLKEAAEETIERCLNLLPVYCMEALRRDSIRQTVAEMINTALPRENEAEVTSTPTFSVEFSLPNGNGTGRADAQVLIASSDDCWDFNQ